MIDYAEWFYRVGRPNCIDCVEIKAESNKKPDCVACGKVVLIPENFLVYGLIEKYSGILLSDMKINPEGIRLAMELEEIEEPREMTQLIITYLSAAIRTRAKKR